MKREKAGISKSDVISSIREQEVPAQGGVRVIDVSKRNFVPPPTPVKIVRDEYSERRWSKYRRILTP
jgi:hypothetical protein